MSQNFDKVRELISYLSFGDGVTYIQLKDLFSEMEDSRQSEYLTELLDDMFFSAPESFGDRLLEFSKVIDDIEDGKCDLNKKIEHKKKKIDDPELVTDFVIESREGLNEFEMGLLEIEKDKDISHINDIFRTVHTIKGSTGFLELDNLNRYAHINENLLDDLRNGKISISSSIIDYLFSVLDVLKENLDKIEKFVPEGYYPEFDIDVDEVEKTIEKLNSGKFEHPMEAENEGQEDEPIEDFGMDDTDSSADFSEEEQVEDITPRKKDKVAKSIKVDIDKVDFLLDNVGELIVVNNMLFQDENILKIVDKKTQNTLNQLKRVSSRLQNSSMSLRMVPIGATFQKMLRIVRDNSKKLGKQIKLEISGEATEIDRNMVEKLYDPLMHMIRNSCDHGIESAEERKASGKPAMGTISLSAYHKGGNIVIEIADDGKGLSKDAILQKALERGIITDGHTLSDSGIYDLIFQPGFSTAQKVSAISGRGVGMDVVKNTISTLGGRVEIVSTQGKGSAFFIKLPLTLAILDGVVIRIGEERFILPAQVVEEGISPSASDCFNMANKGEVVKVREKIHELVRLYEFFGISADTVEPSESIIIIVETEKDRIGLMVDEILGKQEVVIKNLGSFFRQYNFISGSAIMGDGTISLIIDVNKLLD
ncbi:MAG: chemotaxis protein CheA [Candidatus Muiribacteriaceae bacterium]